MPRIGGLPFRSSGRSPTLHEVKHSGLYLRPVRRFSDCALAPPASCHCLPTLFVTRFLFPSLLPFLFFGLVLFGTSALHTLQNAAALFPPEAKISELHDSLHFLQLRFLCLFFLMTLFSVRLVFRSVSVSCAASSLSVAGLLSLSGHDA